MKTAYALLGLLFIIVFGGAFLLVEPEKESNLENQNADGSIIHSDEDVPIIPDVPRDAIPPLDNPKYDSVSVSDEWLQDDDIVLGVDINGDRRAYPIKIMNWHEIVNETIGGELVAVTYCPLCDSGIVFDRHVNGKLLSFGNTGALYQSAMVMYDRETNSDWWQAGGRAVGGELNGTKLTILPSFMARWEDWKEKYPNSQVLSLDTGHSRPYSRDSFRGYDDPHSSPGFPVTRIDTQLPPKERIVGIEVDGVAKAYPVKLAEGTVIRDQIGDTSVEVVGDSEGRTAEVFFVEDDNRVRAPVISEFWFSWALTHPNTLIYRE